MVYAFVSAAALKDTASVPLEVNSLKTTAPWLSITKPPSVAEAKVGVPEELKSWDRRSIWPEAICSPFTEEVGENPPDVHNVNALCLAAVFAATSVLELIDVLKSVI